MSTATAAAPAAPLSFRDVLRIDVMRRVFYAQVVSLLGDFLALFAVKLMRDPFAFTFPGTSSGTKTSETASPWRGNAADSDLARAAGIDDIGRSHVDPSASAGNSDLIAPPSSILWKIC